MILVIKIKEKHPIYVFKIYCEKKFEYDLNMKNKKNMKKNEAKHEKIKYMTFFVAFKVIVVCILMFQFQTWRVLEALVRVFAFLFFFFAWADVTLLSWNDWRNEYSQTKVELKLLRYPEMSIMVRIYYLTLLMWYYNFEQRNLAWVKFD